MTTYESVEEKHNPSVNNLIGWQYTSKCLVDGYDGNIDLNIYYGELDKRVLSDRSYEVKKIHKHD